MKDPRVALSDAMRWRGLQTVDAKIGLRVRFCRESEEDHENNFGVMRAPAEDEPGFWWVEMAPQRLEKVSCGHNDAYLLLKQCAVKVGLLRFVEAESGLFVEARGAFTGERLGWHPYAAGLSIRTLRASLEAQAGDPNGLRLLLPSRGNEAGRVLKPRDEDRTWQVACAVTASDDQGPDKILQYWLQHPNGALCIGQRELCKSHACACSLA